MCCEDCIYCSNLIYCVYRSEEIENITYCNKKDMGHKEAKYPEGTDIANNILLYLIKEQYGELLEMPKQEFNKIIEVCKILKQTI